MITCCHVRPAIIQSAACSAVCGFGFALGHESSQWALAKVRLELARCRAGALRFSRSLQGVAL